ncbi:MAG TPA: hypothetical protein VF118_18315, partial [Gemmatimonadaceae bacterium]
RELAEWSRRLAGRGDPCAGDEVLTQENLDMERIYLGLRTSDGVDLAQPAQPIDTGMLERWVASGWAVHEGTTLRLTARGWLRLDALATDLTALSSHS